MSRDNAIMKIYLDDGFAAAHGGGIGVYSEIIYAELIRKGMANPGEISEIRESKEYNFKKVVVFGLP